MKSGKRLLAVALTLCLSMTAVTPASAAWGRSGGSSWRNSLFGGNSSNSSSSSTVTSMTLVEDETTVEDGTELRADTYTATVSSSSSSSSKKSSRSKASTVSDSSDTTTVDNGYSSVSVEYNSDGNYSTYTTGDYYVLISGSYYPVTVISCTTETRGPRTQYSWSVSYTNSDGGTSTTSGSDSTYTLYKKNVVTLKYFPVTMYDYNDDINAATDKIDDDKQGVYFYHYDTTVYNEYSSYKKGEEEDWNIWTGSDSVGTGNGNRTHSGIVKDSLDSSNNIQFNYPEAGIFTNDETYKDVYTNVQMPFVYEDRYYTFDANSDGVYFHSDDTQSSTTAQDNGRLYWTDTAQTNSNVSTQDGRKNGWYPYNDTSDTSTVTTSTADYCFGMQQSVKFTMTSNGKLEEKKDNSDDIQFEFSGDDDVWVFIDGVLVLDIGGIHNCLDGTINFADNTYTITKTEGNGGGDVGDAGSSNGENLSGTLFNTDSTTGVLNQTRESFAAKDEHTLTIFYLERGAGSSNCKIRFNLPVKDSVSVQKLVNDEDSAGVDADVSSDTTYGFTLYKQVNGSESYSAVTGTYLVYDENGNYVESRSTTTGHFTLKDGQTAKFVGEIEEDGVSYYVVEDEKSGFETPAFTYTTSGGQKDSSSATDQDGYTSQTVTIKGTSEGEDSVKFVCTNTLKHVNGTSVTPENDEIVIDYGLPVQIDALANDNKTKATLYITGLAGATADEDTEYATEYTGTYGTAKIDSDGKKIIYQLTKQMTGVEVLTYKVFADSTTTESDDTYATAQVYIIPATTMYYEENFSNMVTYTDGKSSGWSEVKTDGASDYQEPGVVGTSTDSPYGSDEAYLSDSRDSNGTSMKVDTTDGAAKFSYTFTGTGTSFFARTSNKTGYMRVVVSDGSKEDLSYRDTLYQTDVDATTLYNIPVFTWEADNYGTYTVTVTIAKANADAKLGSEFYLDGIRVQKPIDTQDTNYTVATSAYATDGESNMVVTTLRDALLNNETYTDATTEELTWNNDSFVVFTDTDGEIKTAETYKSIGPKEEVYLNNGQSVSFSLVNWDTNTNKLYLGIKAPTGSGTVTINNNELTISNAADCYYEISNYADTKTVKVKADDGTTTTAKVTTFKITAGTNSLISLTNVKSTGSVQYVITPQEDLNEVTEDKDSSGDQDNTSSEDVVVNDLGGE